jgi:hypothetical protein
MQLHEDMNVVIHAANCMNEDFSLLANGRDVGPQSLLHFFGDRLAPVFGAEN